MNWKISVRSYLIPKTLSVCWEVRLFSEDERVGDCLGEIEVSDAILKNHQGKWKKELAKENFKKDYR